MRRTIIRSITCWTSSSRSSSTSTRSTVAASRGHPLGMCGLRQPLTQPAGHLRVAQLGLHHLRRQEVLPHEGAQALAELVLLALDDRGVRDRDAQRMLEQRGHGEPVGQRAHHAGLRGRADVADPAPVRAWACAHRQTRNTPVAPIRKLSATTFIRRSATRRSASASGSAPANDSAKDVRASALPRLRQPVGCPTPRVSAVGSVCHHTIIRYRRGQLVLRHCSGGPRVTRPICQTRPHAVVSSASREWNRRLWQSKSRLGP